MRTVRCAVGGGILTALGMLSGDKDDELNYEALADAAASALTGVLERKSSEGDAIAQYQLALHLMAEALP